MQTLKHQIIWYINVLKQFTTCYEICYIQYLMLAEFFYQITINQIELDEDRCLLYVADQYNHRIRMVTTECSDQVASQADSIAHYLKLDGYRDLYIHNYSVFAVLFYTLFVCFVLFVYIFVKYFRLVRILKLQIRKLV